MGMIDFWSEKKLEKFFKRPSFSEPACDGQHGYRVLPANSNVIDI
jgi:hypothetical protein